MGQRRFPGPVRGHIAIPLTHASWGCFKQDWLMASWEVQRKWSPGSGRGTAQHQQTGDADDLPGG